MTEPDKPEKRQKRLLKAAPTIRERAADVAAKEEKVSARRDNPGFIRSFGKGFAWPFRLLARPLRFIGRYTIPPYFRNAWGELRQVTWPTIPTSLRLTSAVLIFAIVFGVLVAGVDFGLDKLFKQILLR